MSLDFNKLVCAWKKLTDEEPNLRNLNELQKFIDDYFEKNDDLLLKEYSSLTHRLIHKTQALLYFSDNDYQKISKKAAVNPYISEMLNDYF